MTDRSTVTHDAIDELLIAYFRPVPVGADLGRRVLDRLRDGWDPGRFAGRVAIEATEYTIQGLVKAIVKGI